MKITIIHVSMKKFILRELEKLKKYIICLMKFF